MVPVFLVSLLIFQQLLEVLKWVSNNSNRINKALVIESRDVNAFKFRQILVELLDETDNRDDASNDTFGGPRTFVDIFELLHH